MASVVRYLTWNGLNHLSINYWVVACLRWKGSLTFSFPLVSSLAIQFHLKYTSHQLALLAHILSYWIRGGHFFSPLFFFVFVFVFSAHNFFFSDRNYYSSGIHFPFSLSLCMSCISIVCWSLTAIVRTALWKQTEEKKEKKKGNERNNNNNMNVKLVDFGTLIKRQNNNKRNERQSLVIEMYVWLTDWVSTVWVWIWIQHACQMFPYFADKIHKHVKIVTEFVCDCAYARVCVCLCMRARLTRDVECRCALNCFSLVFICHSSFWNLALSVLCATMLCTYGRRLLFAVFVYYYFRAEKNLRAPYAVCDIINRQRKAITNSKWWPHSEPQHHK